MAENRPRVKLSTGETMRLLMPYLGNRLYEQIKSIWLIVAYLILFHVLVLQHPIAYAAMIGTGLLIVLFGLMLFMEGLMLGLMRLGEVIGTQLPRKSKLPVILIFAFLLGVGATLAEPAIGVLQDAGGPVSAEDAPLLKALLTEYSGQLVLFVGIGVGIAVMFGMLRFLYDWSLKWLIYPLVILLVGLTLLATFLHEDLATIVGLAWDSGAVTTGPVTVPLVLALGIGICRVVETSNSAVSGFGVVTLASLFPIVAVLTLAFIHFEPDGNYPAEKDENGAEIVVAEEPVPELPLPESRSRFTEADERLAQESGLDSLGDVEYSYQAEGTPKLTEDGSLIVDDVQLVVTPKPSGDIDTIDASGIKLWPDPDPQESFWAGVWDSFKSALRAVLPLTLLLFIFLKLILRERIPRGDEVLLGISLALVGMFLFNQGLKMGLVPLGDQVGSLVPNSFSFFAVDPETGASGFRDALYGEFGRVVALIFAFLLGYGATLAEPALNALGATVERITVGSFKKSLLMQAVAIGVGVGISLGIVPIIWPEVPLWVLLLPPYLLLLPITYFSKEEFVNIGWDSAGVTTGPITVPLVLAMGLGIMSQVDSAVSGFGILAMASVCPILSVLTVGLVVSRSQRRAAARPATSS